MRKEEILNIAKELDITLEEWNEFYEIESINLISGKGIYPNWRHLRFLISKDGDIYVKHGESKPYGARLTLNFSITIDGLGVHLSAIDTVPGTDYYEKFRLPAVGDTLRYSDGSKIVNESIITKVSRGSNCIILDVFPKLNTETYGKLSFYNVNERQILSMHGAPVEGIYMNFFENSGKRHKVYGVFHEIIKPKEVKSINLNIRSKYNQKTFKLSYGGN